MNITIKNRFIQPKKSFLKFSYCSQQSIPELSDRFKYAQTLLNTNVIEVKDFHGGKGLGLISTDFIPKNEIIFQERPYVIVPSFQVRYLSFFILFLLLLFNYLI